MTIVDNNTAAITQSDLPNGWEVANLEDVVGILDSKRVPVNAKERANRVGPIPYYGATGQVGWIDDFLFDEELVLLGEDGAPFHDATKPKAYIVRGKSWVNNHAHVLRALGGIPNGYIKYYLDVFDYHGFVTGTTRLKLNQTSMRRIPVPIAPPNEQVRIVAEIEKQFSRLDEAVDNLKRVKANLKRYKAAVLKAAVEGKLTEEWREKHLPAPNSRPGKFYTYAILCEDKSIYIGHTDDIERRWKEHLEGKGAEWTKRHTPTKIAHYEEFDTRQEAADREKWLKTGYGRKWLKRELAAGRTRQAGRIEPADKLLERILAERRKKWEEAELARLRERAARRQAKMRAKGKMPKGDTWKKKYKKPIAPDIANLQKIPKNWVWTNIGHIAESMKNGIYKPRSAYAEDGVACLRMYNIEDGKIVWKDIKRMRLSDTEIEEYRLIPGDLLVNRVNSRELVGKAAPISSDLELCVFESKNIRVRLLSDCIAPEFVSFRMLVEGQAFFSHNAQQVVGMASISQPQLASLPIPLPSLNEQKKIVIEVERYISFINELEKEVSTSLLRAERLRQSILKKAFLGQLVKPDNNDESNL